jgi:hypothetical protein
MAGFIKNAKSLTLDQWRAEIWVSDKSAQREGPLWKDIIQEITSFPRREPVRSFVASLGLDEYGIEAPFDPDWIIHNVIISDHLCSFPITIYFFGTTKVYRTGMEEIVCVVETPKGRLILDDADAHLCVVGVEAVLHINDNATMSSEIVEVFTGTDGLRARIDYQNADNCLFYERSLERYGG